MCQTIIVTFEYGHNIQCILDYCPNAPYPKHCLGITSVNHSEPVEPGHEVVPYDYPYWCPHHTTDAKDTDLEACVPMIKKPREGAYVLVAEKRWERYIFYQRNVMWFFGLILPNGPYYLKEDNLILNSYRQTIQVLAEIMEAIIYHDADARVDMYPRHASKDRLSVGHTSAKIQGAYAPDAGD